MILGHLRIQFSILATSGPTIAALVTNRLAYGNYRAFRLNASWPRTLGASVIGMMLVLAAFIIFPAVATVDAGKLHWTALASLGVYNYSTLLGGPLFTLGLDDFRRESGQIRSDRTHSHARGFQYPG